MRKKAFTLAEVLITLGIIGIVAEITIPGLILSTQKQEFATALKKVYSVMNQALVQMSNDAGYSGDLRSTGLFETNTDTDSSKFGSAIAKYFKVSQECGTAQNQGCWSQFNYRYDKTGTNVNYDSINTAYKYVTADGISYYVVNSNNSCASYNDATAKNNMTQVCGFVVVDVNGTKSPNRYGVDVFAFYVTNGKGPLLYPFGGQDDNNFGPWQNNYCGSGSSTTANKSHCTGKVMEQGWQINY